MIPFEFDGKNHVLEARILTLKCGVPNFTGSKADEFSARW
jgi:hypothetical protein